MFNRKRNTTSFYSISQCAPKVNLCWREVRDKLGRQRCLIQNEIKINSYDSLFWYFINTKKKQKNSCRPCQIPFSILLLSEDETLHLPIEEVWQQLTADTK